MPQPATRHVTRLLELNIQKRKKNWIACKEGKKKKCRQISTQMRFNRHKINSSSSYIRLDPPGMFCSASSVFCEINGYLSADQVSDSPARRMLDMLCDTLPFISMGHQKSWPTSHGRQPQTLTLWTVFCSLDHSAKQVRAYVMPFNQEWCMPQNMQAAPVNKDFPRHTQHYITF